nr:hypothetical protein [Amycolatopsis sp. H20-H5]
MTTAISAVGVKWTGVRPPAGRASVLKPVAVPSWAAERARATPEPTVCSPTLNRANGSALQKNAATTR